MTSTRGNRRAKAFSKVKSRRNIRKYLILPTCMLVLNIVEEVFCYKSQMISNLYLRTALLMVMFLCGFGLVWLVIAPIVSRSLEVAYFGGKKHGDARGILVLAVVYGVLFYAYYLLYSAPGGAANLLPAAWRNGE
jgi:hypothetical protein